MIQPPPPACRRGALVALAAAMVSMGCAQIPSEPTLISSRGHAIETVAGCIVETPTRAGGLSAERIHLVSWNIQKGQGAAWRDDLAAVSESQSIVLLQEAMIEHGGSPDAALSHWTLVEAFSRGTTHAGVMSAAPIAAHRVCGHAHAEPLIVIPKSMLASHYAVAGHHQTLLVINLHGVNFTLGHRRFREQLSAAAALLAEHDGPAILAGDLNTWSSRRHRIVTRDMANVGLLPVAFEGQQPRRHFGRVLDHVFSRGLEVDEALVVPVESSDHDPISVAFRLAASAP